MKGTPVNLIRILYGNGPVPAGRWPLVALYLLRSLIMVPLSLAERLFCYRKIRGTVIQQPPVFILGHYRSGTTYLHKVLTADKRYGYINTYNIFFPFSFNWMEKMLKPEKFFLRQNLAFHLPFRGSQTPEILFYP